MKAEIKQLWVDALRSGEYEQGLRQLKTTDNKFCCLGVLCDIYRKEVKDAHWNGNGFGLNNGIECYSKSLLPMFVVQWAGLPNESPALNSNASLVELNDSGIDFNRIANAIEKEL